MDSRIVCENFNLEKINSQNPIIYWMQEDHRVDYNYALDFAISLANTHNLPLLVYFTLTDNYPEANLRHYQFMLEGLLDVQMKLKHLNINFWFCLGNPIEITNKLKSFANALIFDKSYLNTPLTWKKNIIFSSEIPIYTVDSKLMVPCNLVSNKEEYAARTIRPKLHKLLDSFFNVFDLPNLNNKTNEFNFSIPEKINFSDIESLISILNVDKSVYASKYYKGGHKEALKKLNFFLENSFKNYENRSNPGFDYGLNMSPYLHFGQISPVEILILAKEYMSKNKIPNSCYEILLEELIIRRELAFNFTSFNSNYYLFNHMTYEWAYLTMKNHLNDPREHEYSLEEFESAKTHDDFWNACMIELIKTGKIHTYMRMYWGKKIIEWTSNYETAFNWMLYLNNKYALDGRDPNSFAGICWCFGKHDRAFKERSVFGKLRFMSYDGLKRKFNMKNYLNRIENL